MSDSAPVTATAPESAPAAPQSTEAITANVIEQLDAADSENTDTPPETRINTNDVTATAEPTAAQKPPTPAELSAAAKFLKKQGHELKKVDGRDTWLPAKTVEGMLDRYVDEHKATWTGERTTLESQAQELRGYVEQLREGVKGDPDAFLRELATHDARYAKYLEPQAPSRQEPPQFDAEMPRPDYQLPDGSTTYSLDGIQKQLIPWLTQAITKQIEGKVDERLKPWTEREKAEQARQHAEQIRQEFATRAKSQIDDARTWPGFTEHETDILQAMKDDSAKAQAEGRRPQLSLEAAWRKVVLPQLIEDDSAKRARLMKELNSAPRSTSITGARADITKPAGPRSTEDIARETIERLGA